MVTFLLPAIFTSWGQERVEDFPFEDYPEKKFRIDVTVSDFALSRTRIGAAYRWNGPHVVGVDLGYLRGRYDMDNNFLTQRRESPVIGYYGNVSYKMYVHRTVNDNFTFFKFTSAYQDAGAYYEAPEWIAYQQGGVTYYRLGQVEKEYEVKTLSNTFEIGFETYRNFIAFEFTFGIQHRLKLNNNEQPDFINSGDQMTDLDYSGFSPYAGFRLSLYIY